MVFDESLFPFHQPSSSPTPPCISSPLARSFPFSTWLVPFSSSIVSPSILDPYPSLLLSQPQSCAARASLLLTTAFPCRLFPFLYSSCSYCSHCLLCSSTCSHTTSTYFFYSIFTWFLVDISHCFYTSFISFRIFFFFSIVPIPTTNVPGSISGPCSTTVSSTTNTHPMITRAKAGISAKCVFLATKHALPSSSSASYDTIETSCYSEATKSHVWKKSYGH